MIYSSLDVWDLSEYPLFNIASSSFFAGDILKGEEEDVLIITLRAISGCSNGTVFFLFPGIGFFTLEHGIFDETDVSLAMMKNEK